MAFTLKLNQTYTRTVEQPSSYARYGFTETTTQYHETKRKVTCNTISNGANDGSDYLMYTNVTSAVLDVSAPTDTLGLKELREYVFFRDKDSKIFKNICAVYYVSPDTIKGRPPQIQVKNLDDTLALSLRFSPGVGALAREGYTVETVYEGEPSDTIAEKLTAHAAAGFMQLSCKGKLGRFGHYVLIQRTNDTLNGKPAYRYSAYVFWTFYINETYKNTIEYKVTLPNISGLTKLTSLTFFDKYDEIFRCQVSYIFTMADGYSVMKTVYLDYDGSVPVYDSAHYIATSFYLWASSSDKPTIRKYYIPTKYTDASTCDPEALTAKVGGSISHYNSVYNWTALPESDAKLALQTSINGAAWTPSSVSWSYGSNYTNVKLPTYAAHLRYRVHFAYVIYNYTVAVWSESQIIEVPTVSPIFDFREDGKVIGVLCDATRAEVTNNVLQVNCVDCKDTKVQPIIYGTKMWYHEKYYRSPGGINTTPGMYYTAWDTADKKTQTLYHRFDQHTAIGLQNKGRQYIVEPYQDTQRLHLFYNCGCVAHENAHLRGLIHQRGTAITTPDLYPSIALFSHIEPTSSLDYSSVATTTKWKNVWSTDSYCGYPFDNPHPYITTRSTSDIIKAWRTMTKNNGRCTEVVMYCDSPTYEATSVVITDPDTTGRVSDVWPTPMQDILRLSEISKTILLDSANL